MDEPSAIEVIREGRFRWQVKTRYPNGFDMELQMPLMFRWSAERRARKQADEHRQAGQPQVVTRYDLGVERELSGLMADVIAAHTTTCNHPGQGCPDDDLDVCIVRVRREAGQ